MITNKNIITLVIAGCLLLLVSCGDDGNGDGKNLYYRIAKIETYDGDNNLKSTTVYEYDSEGRASKYEETDTEGNIVSSSSLFYDSSNLLIRETYQENNSKGVYVYSYDSQGRLVKEEDDESADGSVESVTEYFYNANENVYQKVTTHVVHGSSTTDYKYNADNQLIQEIDSDDHILWDYIYENGKLTEIKSTNTNTGNTYPEVTYKYEGDKLTELANYDFGQLDFYQKIIYTETENCMEPGNEQENSGSTDVSYCIAK